MSKFEIHWSEITVISYKMEIEAKDKTEAEDIWIYMDNGELDAKKERIIKYEPDYELEKIVEVSE